MSTQILIKRSTTTGAVPTTSDIATGELAINTVDKRIFTNNEGTIVELGTTPTTQAVTGNASVGGTFDVVGAVTVGNLTADGTVDLTAATVTIPAPTADTHPATKKYVDDEVNAILDGAPAALDTLNEIAAAINDDANLYTTLTTSIATKLSLAGGTMTGSIDMGANSVTTSADPATANTLTRKSYVDGLYQSTVDAEVSAAAALASEQAAATSASNASTSASTATTQASAASSSATNAATSATAAAGSATSAANSATSAATSATSAGTSATNADASETAAATSETNAAASETAAAASAASASTSASTATTQATAASASATAALASETAAATSETNAASSATAAASSASSASTSATAASSAKTAAESARDATLAAYDSFDDRYLGAKSSAPTVDNDGNALVAGALYFDTVSEAMKLYTGSAWVDSYANGADFVNKAGDSMTGDLTFGDNDKAIFGAGSDLEIFHDGNNSYIKESGTGSLLVRGVNLSLQDSSNGENYLVCQSNNEVSMYFDGAKKLATTSTGIDVTGTVVSDGLDVAGSVKLDGNYPVGTSNTALGRYALDDGVFSGTANVALGYATLSENETGSYNTAVGSSALYANTTANNNTAIGNQAGIANTTGSVNTTVGSRSLYSNSTGNANTAVGYQSLFNNTTGSNNVALGTNYWTFANAPLYANTTGSQNSVLGAGALSNNSTGNNNSAVGSLALLSNTSGYYNNAFGVNSLRLNTTGYYNVAIGSDALYSNTTASNNTAVGYQAGYRATTGIENTFVGKSAGYNSTTNGYNTAMGNNSQQNATGAGNTSFGLSSGRNLTGSYNTCIGFAAGEDMTSGSKNTILGRYNGNQDGLDIRTASNNVVLSDGDGRVMLRIDGNKYIDIFGRIYGENLGESRIAKDAYSDPQTGQSRDMKFGGAGIASWYGYFNSLAKGSGSFCIDHPLPEKTETHNLVHSFVESPQANNIYRGKVALVDGTASINLDTESGMTEGTFVLLNRDIHCFTSNESGWTAVRGSVEGNVLTIEAQDASCTDTVAWLVIGERQDKHMYDTDWTDENGKVIVEPLKPEPTE